MFKEAFMKVIPASYRNDTTILNTIFIFLFIGLLIRLIFMPFTCHADLLSEYWRAHMLAYHFDLQNPYSFIDVLHGFLLFCLKVFMPGNLDTFFHPWGHPPEKWTAVIGWGTSSVQNWLTFISQDSIFRVLFLFKLPYLFFELASVFLCLHIFDDQKRGLKIFKYWMLNPIIIYSAYIYGRFDVMVLFFLIMFFYSIKKWNIQIGSLFLGFSIVLRGFSLLFLPFCLMVKKGIYNKLQIIILAFIPIIGYKVFSHIIFSNGGGLRNTALSSSSTISLPFITPRFVDYVIAVKIGSISLFIVGYILLILFILPKFNILNGNRMKTVTDLNDIFLIVICLLFSFGWYLSTHWFIWIVPFLLIKASESKEFFYAHIYIIFGWILFWITYMTGWVGSSIFGLGLFASINPAFVDYATIGDILVKVTAFPHETLVVISKSIWVATLLFMVYLIIQRRQPFET